MSYIMNPENYGERDELVGSLPKLFHIQLGYKIDKDNEEITYYFLVVHGNESDGYLAALDVMYCSRYRTDPSAGFSPELEYAYTIFQSTIQENLMTAKSCIYQEAVKRAREDELTLTV